MRETSEAPDDIGVQLCPACEVGIAKRAHERDRTLLVAQAFGVLEWEIEKLPLGRRDLSVQPASNCAFGHPARKRIGRESIRLAAEHVAGKLIEHNDERKRRIR